MRAVISWRVFFFSDSLSLSLFLSFSLSLSLSLSLSFRYAVTFAPDGDGENFAKCHSLANTLLRKESNAWCDFAHGGDCSYAGIYQPPLPEQTPHFGDFFAFANYLHIWKFLRLDIRATVKELRDAADHVCGMTWKELQE